MSDDNNVFRRKLDDDDPPDYVKSWPGWGSKPNAKAVNGHAKPAGKPIEFTLFADVEPALDLGDFVEDLLTSSSLAVVFGEPGCGKTFWVLDICLHVAAGLPWQGRAVEQGAVIYFALEGGGGIRNRIAAARAELGLPASTPFVLIQQPMDLCRNVKDRADIISTIEAVTERLGMPVRLVVIDTLARALAGGNENAPEDMGALVANADHIRHKTGVCLLLIHHCGKDAGRGTRGHSSLKGANDTEIEVIKAEDGTSVATVTRQRDLESGARFAFRLASVELGKNPRGKAVTSCVVAPAEAGPAVPPRMTLTNDEKVALRTLDQAMRADAITATVFDDNTEGLVVRVGDWRGWFYREGVPGREAEARKKAFQRVLASLLAKGRIGTRDDLIWPMRPGQGGGT